ncbi:MAG TPA: T9SS type A sorting domain-containing protein [Chitinophagaceae bacterium]|nr:T9SS type A sorting domain-containing protein [Chitinophagaceae bacterium]
MQRIILLITLFLFCGYTNAQNIITNNGNLQIHTGASVSGFGSFNNTSTAALVNNGNLYIKGDISNSQSSMATGTGILYLNGTSAQSLNGTQPFKTFDLVSDNSAGIIINNNLSVSGAHSFTNGIITTSAAPNYLVYEDGSSYSGDGDTRHVNGWVKKMGSSDFIFPVGDETVERTVALSSLSANSEFNAKYFANTPFPYQLQDPVREVTQPEYWAVNKVSGGTASVTLNWDYSKVYFPNWIVPDILVAGYNGSLWVNNGGTASGSTATTGTITSSSVSAFNLFTFGSRSYVLPLTLISFTAKRQDNITQLAWTTANEFNMNRFVIERSDDNIRFYTIGESPARNSGNTEKYFGRDNRAINGIAYYRLRSIDIDGKEKLSPVVTVTDSNTNNLLNLGLNPVNDHIILLATPGLRGLFDYQVTSMNGQLMQQGKLSISNGGQYKLLLKDNVRSGTYLLKVNNGSQSFTFKLIKS